MFCVSFLLCIPLYAILTMGYSISLLLYYLHIASNVCHIKAHNVQILKCKMQGSSIGLVICKQNILLYPVVFCKVF